MIAGVISLVLIVAGGIYLIFFADFTDYAAKVDDHAIEQTALDAGVESRMVFYRQADQEVDESVLRKDVLDQMIDKHIVETYADENGIFISDEELQEYYAYRINSAGSEEELLAIISEKNGLDKTEYLAVLSYDLLRAEVQTHVGQPLGEWLETQRADSDIIIKL